MVAKRALILDLDGTLVDTVYAHEAAWQQALEEAGTCVVGRQDLGASRRGPPHVRHLQRLLARTITPSRGVAAWSRAVSAPAVLSRRRLVDAKPPRYVRSGFV